MKKLLLLTVSILLLSSAYLFSAVPCKINYQGRLIKDNVPVDGTKTMVFSIYTVATGGSPIWTSGNVSISVHNGLFRYVIGTDGGDLSSIDWTAGQVLYLQVMIDKETLTPREEISAYPYAINSHLLEGKTTDYFLNASTKAQTKQGNLNIMGNVGIGTTDPGTNLEVVASDGANGIIVERAGTDRIKALGDGTLYWGSDATYGSLTWNTGHATVMGLPGYDLSLGSNGNEDELYIESGGNVGIGTESPGAKLEVAGNFRATGGIEPDWDSGWVYVNKNNYGLKKIEHTLDCFPRQIQWWFSPGDPGSWVGPVAWSKEDHWSSPIGVWITQTEIQFTIWKDRCVYRGYNGSAWQDYSSGYYRILLWK